MGAASRNATIQIIAMMIFDACFDERARSGFNMALCLSIAIAVSVKIDTLTESVWIKGQNGHINFGKSQRCSTAAWNWKGIENIPIITSAIARLAVEEKEDEKKIKFMVQNIQLILHSKNMKSGRTELWLSLVIYLIF